MLNIFGLKNCDSCRKAIKALEAGGIDHSFTDLRAEKLDRKTVINWLDTVGTDVLVNTRSTTWRGLSDQDRQRADGKNVADLLIEYPALIKRPVIMAESKVLVGWTPQTQAAVL